MRTWSEAVDRAITAFRSGQYVYLYGAKDVLLTSPEQILQYFRAEPAYFSRYSDTEKQEIIRNSLGKRAADCSGFVGWVCTGDKQYSIGQINNCSKYNSLQTGPTGSIIFTTWGGSGRHIGLDVGGGLCMHIGWESTDKAIREGRAGIIFEPIANRAWERSGQSNCVDYSGAYSPYGPTAQLWAELHPNPQPVPFEGWVGEVYGKALVTVYQNATGSTPLASYPALALGNLFEVIGESANRWQIKIANMHIGWIDKAYVLRKTPKATGTVTTALWLRTGAGGNKTGITVMPEGSKVQICDQKPAVGGQPWDYVIFNGIYGFCSDRYIKK